MSRFDIPVFFLALAFFWISDVNARDIFVDNKKNDTDTNFYGSIQKAIDHSKAYDRIIIKSGLYNESIKIKNKKNLEIIGDEVVILESGIDTSLNVESSEYITVSGLTFKGLKNTVRIFKVRDSKFSENIFSSLNGKSPIVLKESSSLSVLNSIFIGGNNFNKIVAINIDDFLFRGNIVKGSSHTAFQVQKSKKIVVKENVFLPIWSRAVEFFQVDQLVFEGNIVGGSFSGFSSADGSSKFIVTRSRISSNTFFNNNDTPISIYPYRDDMSVELLKIHDNTFFNNYPAAIEIRDGKGLIKGVNISGNIFWNNHNDGTCGYVRLVGNEKNSVLSKNSYKKSSSCKDGYSWLGGRYRPEKILSSNDYLAIEEIPNKPSSIVLNDTQQVAMTSGDHCKKKKTYIKENPGSLEFIRSKEGLYIWGEFFDIIHKKTVKGNCFYVIKKRKNTQELNFTFKNKDDLKYWKFYKPYPTAYRIINNALYIYNYRNNYFRAEVNIKNWLWKEARFLNLDYKIVDGADLRVCLMSGGSEKINNKLCIAGDKQHLKLDRKKSRIKVSIDLNDFSEDLSGIQVLKGVVFEKKYNSDIKNGQGIMIYHMSISARSFY